MSERAVHPPAAAPPLYLSYMYITKPGCWLKLIMGNYRISSVCHVAIGNRIDIILPVKHMHILYCIWRSRSSGQSAHHPSRCMTSQAREERLAIQLKTNQSIYNINPVFDDKHRDRRQSNALYVAAWAWFICVTAAIDRFSYYIHKERYNIAEHIALNQFDAFAAIFPSTVNMSQLWAVDGLGRELRRNRTGCLFFQCLSFQPILVNIYY